MSEPEEPDTDDFEVVLFDENGNPVGTMPYKKAKAYFRKRGIDFDDESAAANATPGNTSPVAGAIPGNPQGGSPVPPKTRATSRYFGKPSGNQNSQIDAPIQPGNQPI